MAKCNMIHTHSANGGGCTLTFVLQTSAALAPVFLHLCVMLSGAGACCWKWPQTGRKNKLAGGRVVLGSVVKGSVCQGLEQRQPPILTLHFDLRSGGGGASSGCNMTPQLHLVPPTKAWKDLATFRPAKYMQRQFDLSRRAEWRG